MVKTLKVVDVAQEAQPAIEETQIEQPIEEPIQEESVKEVVVEEPPTQEPIHGKTAKTPEEIVCEHCNKKMLMKTYKYSHQKVCKATPPPPPPPPPEHPPTPEPKKSRPPRVSKPKEPIVTPIAKPIFNNEVSFNEMRAPPVVDPCLAMREQRVVMKTQRIKSLISQAL
jgi:hypothetical protein